MERDLVISVEMLAVFVRFWLTTNPSLPEPAQAAARAQAGERYDAFVAALGRRLAKGTKVRAEISADVAGIAGAGEASREAPQETGSSAVFLPLYARHTSPPSACFSL